MPNDDPKIKCQGCGISIAEPPQDATSDELLCNNCNEIGEILTQAQVRFPDETIVVRGSFADGFEVLLGPSGEHCYAAEKLENDQYDFEQRD